MVTLILSIHLVVLVCMKLRCFKTVASKTLANLVKFLFTVEELELARAFMTDKTTTPMTSPIINTMTLRI